MSLKFNPITGPQLVLRTPRLIRWVHKEADLFHLTQKGDIPGIQRMFSAGTVSPLDMTVAQGETALFHAASFGQFKTCKFLLDAGADINAANLSQVCLAVEWVLSGKLDPHTAQFVQVLFDDEDFLISRQFSIIHKIFLGILPMKNLAKDLAASSSSIDSIDISGKTSLAWAAFRADRHSLQILLDHRADVNKHDRSRSYPLHYAALARDPCCIQPLLDSGADVNSRNDILQTPLHLASREHDDGSFIELLLCAGADINAGDCEGETPLMYATRKGRLRSAEVLLAHGANANARTIWGLSTLELCILYGSSAMLEFLLKTAVKISTKDVHGRTILDYAHRHGGVDPNE
ncbi:hypothetical protein PITC_038130 [Penicillium italicum]|uniref:Uncharacterized protein n=1 Tax=Penicillium italicum TaxID=40296 RepID=A0A0A2KSQ4_PENIT|nr:hypothetical protein PITC_038130 [Penicillium italicum]